MIQELIPSQEGCLHTALPSLYGLFIKAHRLVGQRRVKCTEQGSYTNGGWKVEVCSGKICEELFMHTFKEEEGALVQGGLLGQGLFFYIGTCNSIQQLL